MKPDEIKQARQKLGLTARQMGQMLDINDTRTYRAYEAPEAAAMHRPPAARMIRLIDAYCSGYRPKDWPA